MASQTRGMCWDLEILRAQVIWFQAVWVLRKHCLKVQSGFFNSRGIALERPLTQNQRPKAVFMDLHSNEHLQSGKPHLGLATQILSQSTFWERIYFKYLTTFAEIGLICKLEHFKNFLFDCSSYEVPVFLGLLQRALKLIEQGAASLIFSCCRREAAWQDRNIQRYLRQ